MVLVHGAWMGASAWDRVATDLRARGISVTAVALPGHGQDRTPPSALTLANYVKAVEAALPAQGQATVVGHSMAGMVISAPAESMPDRVASLVYVAAYLPQSGNSLNQLSQQDPESRVGQYWTQADPKAYSPVWIRPEGLVEVFCADCSAAEQKWLVDHPKPGAVQPLDVTLASLRIEHLFAADVATAAALSGT